MSTTRSISTAAGARPGAWPGSPIWWSSATTGSPRRGGAGTGSRWLLPTAVDTAAYRVEPLPERPVIGWIGSAGNLRYLEAIAPALAEVARRFPGVSIAVCCEVPPDSAGPAGALCAVVAAAEADFLASITLGVMPLDDGPWERGKCSYKMLQYLASGRPCFAGRHEPRGFGASRDRVAATTQSEWVAALSAILADRASAEQFGFAGRALVEGADSLEALAPRLAGLIRALAAA